jgi:putative Holliday junction resolvase
MRILAVDPGEKRLGIAISDPTGTIATPNSVIQHKSKSEDAARIAALAEKHGCETIVIGTALSAEGEDTDSSRRARNLAAEIRRHSGLQVVLWDESGSTGTAKEIAISIAISKKKRAGHLDDRAAAVILQDYLDTVDPGR